MYTIPLALWMERAPTRGAPAVAYYAATWMNADSHICFFSLFTFLLSPFTYTTTVSASDVYPTLRKQGIRYLNILPIREGLVRLSIATWLGVSLFYVKIALLSLLYCSFFINFVA